MGKYLENFLIYCTRIQKFTNQRGKIWKQTYYRKILKSTNPNQKNLEISRFTAQKFSNPVQKYLEPYKSIMKMEKIERKWGKVYLELGENNRKWKKIERKWERKLRENGRKFIKVEENERIQEKSWEKMRENGRKLI